MNNGMGQYFPPQMPQQSYATPLQSFQGRDTYREKANYERMKAEIEIEKNQIMLQQRLEYEVAREDMKLQSRLCMGMISYEVYQDSMGQMIYTQVGANGEKLRSKVLMNVINYEAVILVSYSSKQDWVLAVSWYGSRNCNIYLRNTEEGISPKFFLKCLKARGVILQVAKRNENEVAGALLSYSLNTKKEIEIPYYRGWNEMGNGSWHFAKKGELTMKGVIEDAV